MSTLILSVLGGVLTLDQTSLGQFMLSRPLVSASLAGWILGNPEAGILAGAILEVLFLPAFPVGGARFPEGGPAGVVAVAASAAAGGGAAGLALGVGLGTVWGVGAGWSVTFMRRMNERIAPAGDGGTLRPAQIVAGHVSGLVLDFTRGAAVTALGVVTARILARIMPGAWILGGVQTGLALAAVAALSMGGLLAGLGGWKRSPAHLVSGLVVGGLLGWLL